MNRLRELRLLRGLTGAELAARVGTSQAQIHKLETGQRKLTVEWMQRLAKALDVAPIDLIQAALAADLSDDIRPYKPADPVLAAVSSVPLKGLQFCEVLSDVLERRGLHPHDILLIDASADATSAVADGASVIARVEVGGRSALRLRQFVAPALLITNRAGRNEAVDLNGPDLSCSIVGVVLHKIERGNGVDRPRR